MKTKKYLTHDNGGRLYEVIVDDSGVTINNNITNKLIKKYTPVSIIRVIPGVSTLTNKRHRGNSVLLELNNKYVFIGHEIYTFKLAPGDEFVKYFSLVGNSDVPYPILLGKENVYFMLDKKYVPRSMFPGGMRMSDWENAYGMFYKTRMDKNPSTKRFPRG